MSNIDKLKSAATKAVDNFDPNMFVETRDVLALLDELEAKDRRIADYQELISGLVGVSSSILREVERINKDAAAGKGE